MPMSTPASRQAQGWDRRKSGLGIAVVKLMVAIQTELYRRLADAGFRDVTYLHGAVIAHLDPEGTRATELARRSGRHKQVIGRLVDELEALGYVERRPESVDRRGKLIVPTERGLELMLLSDEIVADIERRQARQLGRDVWDSFRTTLIQVVDSLNADRGSAALPDDGDGSSRSSFATPSTR